MTAVQTCPSLEQALENLPVEAVRIALDNSSELSSFGKWSAQFSEAVLAIGPERGWSDRERKVLDSREFVRLHLGRRVLRTETACSFGTALLLSAMNSLD